MPKVAIVRPEARAQADVLISQQNGWQAAVLTPMALQIVPENVKTLPEQIARADVFFWVSPSAVELAQQVGFFRSVQANQTHIAVGVSSANALKKMNINALFAENGNDSEAVLALDFWQKLPANSRVLIVRGQNGRDDLANALHDRGLIVDFAEIYQRVAQEIDWQDSAQTCDVVWMTSRELVAEFFRQMRCDQRALWQNKIFYTLHWRIAQSLECEGVKVIHIVPSLQDGFVHYSANYSEKKDDRISK